MTIDAKLVTVPEFEAFIARPENDDRRFELIDGEIVEDMPTEEHGIVVTAILTLLNVFVKANGLGRVVTETRRGVPDDDKNSRIPDVDFTSNERLAGRDIVRKGAVMQMPDLAVEVQSPGQSSKQMVEKAQFYLDNGVRVVWLIYPAKRLIEVLTLDDRDLLIIGDVLEGGDVLPGFSVPVAEVFEDIEG